MTFVLPIRVRKHQNTLFYTIISANSGRYLPCIAVRHPVTFVTLGP